MPNKQKLKDTYDKLSTPEEKILDLLEEINRDKLKGDPGDKGEDGRDGRDGRDGVDGKNGIDGIDGKNGTHGKDGIVISPEEVRDKIASLKGKERLSVLSLKDLEWLKGERGMNWASPGFKVYTDTSLSGDGSFANPLTAAGGFGVTVSIPTPAIDGNITVFNVLSRPKWIVSDGTTLFEGVGYTYASLSISLDNPPQQSLRAIL